MVSLELRAERGFLQEKSSGRVELVPFSRRVQAWIGKMVEYPSGPSRHASTPNSWMVTEWLDYQVEKLAQRKPSL